jgi:hypothetical protein
VTSLGVEKEVGNRADFLEICSDFSLEITETSLEVEKGVEKVIECHPGFLKKKGVYLESQGLPWKLEREGKGSW